MFEFGRWSSRIQVLPFDLHVKNVGSCSKVASSLVIGIL